MAAEVAAHGPVKITAEQLGLNQGDEYEGQLDYDLGNLAAFDPSPFDPAQLQTEGDPDASCLALAQAMTQSLITRLFKLPSEPVQGGRLAHLPPPSTPLPREKPLPKTKELTKWQKFAQQKGITKRKRSKLEYDEATQSWKRRWGYKKANDDLENPIIEAKASDKVGEDPFSKMAAERKERVKKNKAQQLGNVKQAAKKGGQGAIPVTLRLAASLDAGKGGKRKELKDEIGLASRQAGVSTASMGKFDKRLHGEKPGERKPLGKRRQFLPVTDTKTEHEKVKNFADKFLRERADDIIDVRKAIGHFEAEAREERHQSKRQKRMGDGKGGKAGKGAKGLKGADGKGGKGGKGFKGKGAGGKQKGRGK